LSKIALSGNASGTGTLTLSAPNTDTDRTLTLPDNTGTIITTGSTFAGTGPAFSAYINGNQTISNVTQTKVAFNAENFDTNNNYDSSTNYRFTPTIAGYYFVNANVLFNSMTGVQAVSIYKNGTRYLSGDAYASTSNANNVRNSALVYMNGSTDYVEIYAYQSSGGSLDLIGNTTTINEFSAVLVRDA
jgi:hypothetical protein